VTAHPGWWRLNRWWLPALPLALAAMLAASAYNVKDYWYVNGLHHEAAAGEQGEFVSVTDDYDDAVGRTSRSFEVRLAGIETVDEYPFDFDRPQPVPEGRQALVAHLDWEAAPDQVLRHCHVALMDDEGRRYEIVGNGQSNACTPEDRPGPEKPFTAESERGQMQPGEERPETWSTDPVFLLPDDVEVTRVLVWWEFPDYVALSVS